MEQQCKILIIDDEPINTVLLEEALALAGVIHACNNSEKALELIKDIEPDISKLEKGDNLIYLKPNHVAHLRFLALKHLNDIEIALLHWKEETGEKRIFEEQLGYLVCCKSKRYIMQNFRNTYRDQLGGDMNPYPCIDAFVLKMKE